MPELRVGAFRDKQDEIKKGLEAAAVATYHLQMFTPRIESWVGTDADFEKELKDVDALVAGGVISLTKGIILKEWKRTERQIRAVGAPWGTAGGKKRYFDGYARGAVPLGDFIEQQVYGTANDRDVLLLVMPILRRFQDLNWGSWHERDVTRPTSFAIQSQPIMNPGKGGGSGTEGMEPPLAEEEQARHAASGSKHK